jgi:DNA-binding transcriptional ArsR family regulator
MNQTIFHLFRQELPRKIILFLSTYPDATLVDIARRWEKDPRTISYHMDKLIKEGFLESIPDGNKKRFRLDNEEKIFDFLVTYEKNDFGETYRTWMKYFNKKNKDGDFLDKAFNVFWDICPHPYHI